MHRFSSINLSAVVAAVSLAVTGTALASPAAAGNDPGSSAQSSSAATTAVAAPVSSDLRESVRAGSSALDRSGGDPRVLEYWTPERMANAVPDDTPRTDRSEDRSSTLSPGAEEAVAPSKAVAAPAPAPDDLPAALATDPVTNFSPTNGRVFFLKKVEDKPWPQLDRYEPRSCSGSAINSDSRRLVATAGHCVHGGPGMSWHENWVFVPGYKDGATPHGKFAAASMRTFDDWINYGQSGRGFNSDVAFVTTHTNSSDRKVVDAVGGHGLRTGGSRVFDVTIFGYPGNRANGERMSACWGTTGTRWIGLYQFPSIKGCDFGPGSSGGPWLHEYSNTSGQGYLRSVTSHGPTGSTEYISGPYFDDRVPKLFHAADDDGEGL